MNDKDWNDYLIGQATGVSPPGSMAGQYGAQVHKMLNPPRTIPTARPNRKSAPVGYAGAGTVTGGGSLAKGVGGLLLYGAIGYVGYLVYQGWFTDARIATFGAWVRNALYFGVLPIIGLIVLGVSWGLSDRTVRGTLRWLWINVVYGLPVWLGGAYVVEWLRKAAELPPLDLFAFSLPGAFILVLITLPAGFVALILSALLQEGFGAQGRPLQLFLFFGARRRAKLRNELSVLLRDGKGKRLKADAWRDGYLADVLYRFIFWRASGYFRKVDDERLNAITLSEYRRAARASGVKGEIARPEHKDASTRHGGFLAAALKGADTAARPRFKEEYAKEVRARIEAAAEDIPHRSGTAAYQKAILDRYWHRYLA